MIVQHPLFTLEIHSCRSSPFQADIELMVNGLPFDSTQIVVVLQREAKIANGVCGQRTDRQ